MLKIAGFRYGALENRVHSELAGDLVERSTRAFELKRGGARDDAKIGSLGEHGGELVGESGGGVILGRIAGKIFEREDGDRMERGGPAFE